MADLERMYIDGEWILAEGGATFDVKNPADGSVVARVANAARTRNSAGGQRRARGVPGVVGPAAEATAGACPQGPGAHAGAARRASRGS